MAESYKGINTATNAADTGLASPLALAHQVIDNSAYTRYMGPSQTWSWVVSETTKTTTPLIYAGSNIEDADDDLKNGFIDFKPNGLDYNSGLAGLEISTPPWEPTTLVLPYEAGELCDVEVFITCRVLNHGGTNMPMFAWAVPYSVPPDSNRLNPINGSQYRVNVTNNASFKRFVPSGNVAFSENDIFIEKPPNLLRMQPKDNIQIFKLVITREQLGDMTGRRNILPNQKIFLHFLSTTNNQDYYDGNFDKIFYRQLMQTERNWNWTFNGHRSNNEVPGKYHSIIRYTRSLDTQSTDHFYIMQQRPLNLNLNESTSTGDPYQSRTCFLFHPAMTYQQEDSDDVSRMLAVDNSNDYYELLGLSYIKILSITAHSISR